MHHRALAANKDHKNERAIQLRSQGLLSFQLPQLSDRETLETRLRARNEVAWYGENNSNNSKALDLSVTL